MKDKQLQDIFLEQVKKQAVPVMLNLMTGFQVKGLVTGFDSFTIVADCDGRQTLIYKHAVASIIPAKPIKLDLQPILKQD